MKFFKSLCFISILFFSIFTTTSCKKEPENENVESSETNNSTPDDSTNSSSDQEGSNDSNNQTQTDGTNSQTPDNSDTNQSNNNSNENNDTESPIVNENNEEHYTNVSLDYKITSAPKIFLINDDYYYVLFYSNKCEACSELEEPIASYINNGRFINFPDLYLVNVSENNFSSIITSRGNGIILGATNTNNLKIENVPTLALLKNKEIISFWEGNDDILEQLSKGIVISEHINNISFSSISLDTNANFTQTNYLSGNSEEFNEITAFHDVTTALNQSYEIKSDYAKIIFDNNSINNATTTTEVIPNSIEQNGYYNVNASTSILFDSELNNSDISIEVNNVKIDLSNCNISSNFTYDLILSNNFIYGKVPATMPENANTYDGLYFMQNQNKQIKGKIASSYLLENDSLSLKIETILNFTDEGYSGTTNLIFEYKDDSFNIKLTASENYEINIQKFDFQVIPSQKNITINYELSKEE